MLNTKIIASEVCNLTDARYFAAWGVDYMAFHCNPSSELFVTATALAEIRGWVEGPGILGIVTSDQDVTDLCKQLSLNGFISPDLNKGVAGFTQFKPVSFNDLEQSNQKNLIIKVDNLDQFAKLKSISSSLQNCYLEIEPALDTVKEIIADGNLGLVLKGGIEEKVGFKSYEHYDELYELFMD